MTIQLPKDLHKNSKVVEVTTLDMDHQKMTGVAYGGKNLGVTGKPKGKPPASNSAGTKGKASPGRFRKP